MFPAFQSATAHSRFVACSLLLLVFGGRSAIAQDMPTAPKAQNASALLAQSQDPPLRYTYGPSPDSGKIAPPMHVPAKLSECEAGQCGIWELSGATGHARWSRGGMASLTVDRFGMDGITIRRDDYAGGGTPGFTAVYTGKVFGDQIKGEVEWFWAGHWPAPTHGTWAATILEPAGYALLDPGLPCKPSYGMSSQEALERGVQAMNARNADAGVCWLRIAADQGDPAAEGTLAAVLYKGVGVPVNIPEAAKLAQKAAAGGNYVGERCLSLMYGNGDGFPKDAAKAEYWRAKAQQDKLAAIEAEQQADEEFQRQQQEARAIQNLQDQSQARAQQAQQDQSLGMLQLLFGMFSGGGSSGDSDLAEYNRLNERCISKNDYETCQKRNDMRDSLRSKGIAVE